MGIGNVLVLAQVTGYLLALVFSLFLFPPLAANLSDFHGHCLLNAEGKQTHMLKMNRLADYSYLTRYSHSHGDAIELVTLIPD